MNQRYLYILRHAKAEQTSADGTDHARPLADKGQRQMASLCEQWPEVWPLPTHVFCSDSKRTVQTFEALQPIWPSPPVFEADNALYLASAGELLHYVNLMPQQVTSAMLIGHNPGMHQLVMMLPDSDAVTNSADIAALQAGFPTAACAWFSIQQDWASVTPQSAILTGYIGK